MDFITAIPSYALPFIVVLSVLVFVHELGHYLAARWCGVAVETFSIGFGKELFGFKDKYGTRWKFSMIPLGGYVQMYGDLDPASSEVDPAVIKKMTKKQKAKAFFNKTVGERSFIVFAGPAINFLYAILVMGGLFWVNGQYYAPALAGGIIEDSAAERAGFLPDDVIVSIDGISIKRFGDMQRIITVSLDKEMDFVVQRGEEQITITAQPEKVEKLDRFGFVHSTGMLGIVSAGEIERQDHSLISALGAATQETWSMTVSTLKAVGQIVVGARNAKELGGVVRIGAYAKEFSDNGLASLIMFSAIISINLGLINLFPIPLLDGGHLVFYAYEAVFGQPMNEKVRMAGMKIGYFLIITLMIYATLNDLVQLNLPSYVLGDPT